MALHPGRPEFPGLGLGLQTSDLTPSSDANPLLSAAYLSGAFSDEFDSKVHFAGWLASAKVALKNDIDNSNTCPLRSIMNCRIFISEE